MNEYKVKNVKTGEIEIIKAATVNQALFAALAIAGINVYYSMSDDGLYNEDNTICDSSLNFVVIKNN